MFSQKWTVAMGFQKDGQRGKVSFRVHTVNVFVFVFVFITVDVNLDLPLLK